MANSFKKYIEKIRSLTDIDMLLMVEVLEEGYFTLFIDMQKLITNT